MKICYKCETKKDLSEFNKRLNSKDGHNNMCKECSKKYRSEHYINNKHIYYNKRNRFRNKQRDLMLEYLSDKKCADCGVSDIEVLEFDHKREKLYNVGEMLHNFSFKNIINEINKCDIVCANCHRKRTHRQFGSYRIK